MRVLLIGFLCCLLAGGQDRATGVYEMPGEREAASELSLKANGIFEFAFVYGSTDYWAKGRWKRDETRSSCRATARSGRPSAYKKASLAMLGA